MLQKDFEASHLSRAKSVTAIGRFNPNTSAAAAAGDEPIRQLLRGLSQVHAKTLAES
jgi:hypothetical protein